MLYRPPKPTPKGCEPCTKCGQTGRVPRPRQSWEPPLIGDDTITCTSCGGLGYTGMPDYSGDAPKGET